MTFPAVAQRLWASAARPPPPQRKPAGPGARRRPAPRVAPTSAFCKTIPAGPRQMQALVGRCVSRRVVTLASSTRTTVMRSASVTARRRPRHQHRMRVAHRPRGRGPPSDRWDLVPGQTPQRFRRGLDACRARQRATPTQTSMRDPWQTSPQLGDDSRAHQERSLVSSPSQTEPSSRQRNAFCSHAQTLAQHDDVTRVAPP
jgi:hypothetical protein